MKISLPQLAEITGRCRRTIYDWLEKGLPREADGDFDLAKFIKWFEKYIKSKLPPRGIEKTNTIQQKRMELMDVKLEIKKMELAALRKKLNRE